MRTSRPARWTRAPRTTSWTSPRARLQEVSGFAEETHDEYAILDRAGRLQIPREMLEAAGVTGNQVRLEMQGGRIVLTAPEEQRDA